EPKLTARPKPQFSRLFMTGGAIPVRERTLPMPVPPRSSSLPEPASPAQPLSSASTSVPSVPTEGGEEEELEDADGQEDDEDEGEEEEEEEEAEEEGEEEEEPEPVPRPKPHFGRLFMTGAAVPVRERTLPHLPPPPPPPEPSSPAQRPSHAATSTSLELSTTATAAAGGAVTATPAAAAGRPAGAASAYPSGPMRAGVPGRPAEETLHGRNEDGWGMGGRMPDPSPEPHDGKDLAPTRSVAEQAIEAARAAAVARAAARGLGPLALGGGSSSSSSSSACAGREHYWELAVSCYGQRSRRAERLTRWHPVCSLPGGDLPLAAALLKAEDRLQRLFREPWSPPSAAAVAAAAAAGHTGDLVSVAPPTAGSSATVPAGPAAATFTPLPTTVTLATSTAVRTAATAAASTTEPTAITVPAAVAAAISHARNISGVAVTARAFERALQRASVADVAGRAPTDNQIRLLQRLARRGGLRDLSPEVQHALCVHHQLQPPSASHAHSVGGLHGEVARVDEVNGRAAGVAGAQATALAAPAAAAAVAAASLSYKAASWPSLASCSSTMAPGASTAAEDTAWMLPPPLPPSPMQRPPSPSRLPHVVGLHGGFVIKGHPELSSSNIDNISTSCSSGGNDGSNSDD
ncbi:hypothetical protein Agub_g1203, partial [Astrephomene gubernaculifera]